MMRCNFKKQVKIFAKDGKTQINKVFNPGQHDVEDVYLRTDYFEALLSKGEVTPVYVAPVLPKTKAQKIAEQKTEE